MIKSLGSYFGHRRRILGLAKHTETWSCDETHARRLSDLTFFSMQRTLYQTNRSPWRNRTTTLLRPSFN